MLKKKIFQFCTEAESVEPKNPPLNFFLYLKIALAERNPSQDVIGTMLSCPELLVASVKESILDAGGIFKRHIVVNEDQAQFLTDAIK